jgi:hypothetical protein
MVNLSQDSIDEFRVRTALESALIQLDASWLILSDLRIDGPGDPAVADYAVIHSRYGIALIDVTQNRRRGKPDQQLRRFLNDRSFTSRFPGALPIVRLVLAPCDAEALERQLRDAFAAAAPIAIGDADWVAAIHALLAPSTTANTRPGFPLFRRPGPRRRAAAERGAPAPQEEPWSVSPGTPNEPPHAAAPEPPPAATEPVEAAAEVAQPQADSPAAPATAETGDGNWRAKPRRQAALSDEPTAGQQIQSLIDLLRQNGVQKRTAVRTQRDAQAEPGLEPAASAAPDSRAPYDGDVAVPGTPAGWTTPSAASPGAAAASPAGRSPVTTTAAAAAPPVSATLAREAATEPKEAEDDILSSTATPHVAAKATVLPAAKIEPRVEPEEIEENVAAAPTTSDVELPTEREYAGQASTPLAAAAPVATDAELSAGSDSIEDVAFSEPSSGVESNAISEPEAEREAAVSATVQAEARDDDAPPLSVSSSIVVPTVETAPEIAAETWTPRETTSDAITAEETSPTDFGELRATRESDFSVSAAPPVVESSIVAPVAFRNLSARREDAIAPPPVQRMRWRSGATAAVLLIALLGGAGAWLRGGSPLPDWLVPTSRSVSIVSALPSSTPTTPPDAAPLPSAGSTTSAPATPAPSPSATPVAAPKPAPPVATPPTPAATQPSPAASPVWTTTTASIAPPKAEIAPPPLPAAKPSEPAKRAALRRAVPPRAVGANAPVANRDAAVASLPQEPQGPQGPPIDAGQLPPLATPAAPVASTASAEAAAAARLHAPTNLTPVRTQASASAPPANATDQACHSYTATRTLLGQPRQVSGLACRDGSGQWQIISELPR